VINQTVSTQIETNQFLIDTRLEIIDRILRKRMMRSERLAIVQEVEAQIQELLADLDPQEVTREDVLRVLAKLDPPEAYLSDSPLPQKSFHHSFNQRPIIVNNRARQNSRIIKGLIGGILGILSVISYILLIYIDKLMIFDPKILGIMAGLPGLTCSVTALILSIIAVVQRQSGWAITGIIGGFMSFPFWFLICYYAI